MERTPIERADMARKAAEGLGRMIDQGKAMRDKKAKEDLFRQSLGIRLKTPKKS